MGTAQAELKPLDGIDLVARYEAMAKELAETKAEAQRMADRNRELLHRNVELRKQLDAGNVLSKESFAECFDAADASIEEYELGKLVLQAVKSNRKGIRDGENLYVTIDLPRSFKVTGDSEFADLTAMRCDSPDRNAVAYEIHVG